jgi:hypothetical protein
VRLEWLRDAGHVRAIGATHLRFTITGPTARRSLNIGGRFVHC